MGVDQRFAGVAGFSYVELVREQREGVYPAGDRPYYCLPKLGVAGPGMSETLSEITVPGLDLCQLTKLLGETRDSGEFSAFVVTSSHGHEMFEVIAPVYARRWTTPPPSSWCRRPSRAHRRDPGRLRARRDDELDRGITLVGPHRDELRAHARLGETGCR